MKLLWGNAGSATFKKGVAVSIGNFDGVHLGHRALLNKLCQEATVRKLPCGVLLFEPQPYEYFHGFAAVPRLASLGEKLELIRSLGMDFVYLIRFRKALATMSAQNFMQRYLRELLAVKYLLVGEDFRFGQHRLGNIQQLEEFAKNKDSQLEIQCFNNFNWQDERVSSTKIRQLLLDNHLEAANQRLGSPYMLCGRVGRGQGLGSKWQVPTANLKMKNRKLALGGVFCVQVKFPSFSASMVQGVANVGYRPTVDGKQCQVEVHLFNFKQMMYGERMQVYFLKKLREEKKFPSIDELKHQIFQDIVAAKIYFQSIYPMAYNNDLGYSA